MKDPQQVPCYMYLYPIFEQNWDTKLTRQGQSEEWLRSDFSLIKHHHCWQWNMDLRYTEKSLRLILFPWQTFTQAKKVSSIFLGLPREKRWASFPREDIDLPSLAGKRLGRDLSACSCQNPLSRNTASPAKPNIKRYLMFILGNRPQMGLGALHAI